MTPRSIHGCILCAIEDLFPAEEFPAENAYLLDLYRSDPELSPALERATANCLALVERIHETDPRLGYLEGNSVGMNQFLEEFSEELKDAAGLTFAGR